MYVQKDNLLKKAAEDMKFYKLELINREQSYNQMFGSNPNVGVINPIGKAPPGMAKQPSMAIGGAGVGMPAKGMGIGGMGISGGASAQPVGAKGADRSAKSRLVQ